MERGRRLDVESAVLMLLPSVCIYDVYVPYSFGSCSVQHSFLELEFEAHTRCQLCPGKDSYFNFAKNFGGRELVTDARLIAFSQTVIK